MSYIFGSRSTRLSLESQLTLRELHVPISMADVHEILEQLQQRGRSSSVVKENGAAAAADHVTTTRAQGRVFAAPAIFSLIASAVRNLLFPCVHQYFVSPTSDAVCTSIPPRLLTLTACLLIYQLRLFRASCPCDVICFCYLICNQSVLFATKHPASASSAH